MRVPLFFRTGLPGVRLVAGEPQFVAWTDACRVPSESTVLPAPAGRRVVWSAQLGGTVCGPVVAQPIPASGLDVVAAVGDRWILDRKKHPRPLTRAAGHGGLNFSHEYI